jgi:hypothetical protein
MNEIQKACESIERTRRRQRLILRLVVLPFVVIYLAANAYIIFCK